MSATRFLQAFLSLLDEPSSPALSTEAVKALIAASGNRWSPLTTTDDNGATALHHLVGVEGHSGAEEAAALDAKLVAIADFFISTDASDAEEFSVADFPADNDGETLLHYAARGGRVAMAEYLLKKAAKSTASSPSSSSASSSVQSLLVAKAEGSAGANPFHYAAKGGHVPLLDVFVQYYTNGSPSSATANSSDNGSGSDLALIKDAGGMTSIHYAATAAPHAALATVTFLLGLVDASQKREDLLLAADNDGTTVLHYAAAGGDIDLVRMIVLECMGAAEKEIDEEGRTVVVLPSASSSTTAVFVDKLNQTPLHFACMSGNGEAAAEVAEFLLSIVVVDGAAAFTPVIDVNAQTAEGKMAALHYAAAMGDEAVMAVLVGTNAVDAALRNEEGMTAEEILAERREAEAEAEEDDCCGEDHDHDGDCCGGDAHDHEHSDGCCGGH